MRIRQRSQYYIRMQQDGVWYFLLRTSHDKDSHCMKPVWWPERMIGVSQPRLYKTIVTARDAQERYVSPLATKSSIEVWRGLAQTKSA